MEHPDKTEVCLGLEPDKLVMQIALATGERADNEITTKPTHIIEVTKNIGQGLSIWIKKECRLYVSIMFNLS